MTPSLRLSALVLIGSLAGGLAGSLLLAPRVADAQVNRGLGRGPLLGPEVITVPNAGLEYRTAGGVRLASMVPTSGGVELTLFDGGGKKHATLTVNGDSGALTLAGGDTPGVALTATRDRGGRITTAHPDGATSVSLRSEDPSDPYFNTVRMGKLSVHSGRDVAVELVGGPRQGIVSLRTPTGQFRQP